MANPVWSRLLLLATALQLGISGCSTPDRLPAVPQSASAQMISSPIPIRYLVARETDSFAAEAQRSLAREQAWLASQGRSGELPPAYFLAISGGGDNGADGAGVLTGWTEAGTRPDVNATTRLH